MERAKIKFMCVKSENINFTVGKVYEGYRSGGSYITDDTGFCYAVNSYNEIYGVKFIPLHDIAFVIRCTKTRDDRFKLGELYFVLKDGTIYDDNICIRTIDTESYDCWYTTCNWIDYSFELVEDYTSWLNISEKQEENKMSNLEKYGLVKGIEEESIKNVFKATTDKRGRITLCPIKMVNLCFVQHDRSDKVYVFENPSDKRIKRGTRVKVDTKYGEKDAVVVSSIKLQHKYLKDFMLAYTGSRITELRKVLGVYKIELVEREYCEDLAS